MKITVAICTWNRPKLLDQTLDGMTRLSIPEGVEWELLVVNNNCSDDTDEIIKKYDTKLPIRRLFEPRHGKSNALNRALKEAQGDYIIWTDDDAEPDREWLIEYNKAFVRWPNTVIFGGQVEPFFEGTPPDWLLQILPAVSYPYAIVDLKGNSGPIINRLPVGANCAMRRKEHLHYPYNPNLGNQGKKSFGTEETDVMKMMLNDGLEGRWVPGARVKHYITRERQKIRSLIRLLYIREVGAIRQGQHPVFDYNVPLLFGRPRWFWMATAVLGIKYCRYRLFSKPEIWIKHLLQFLRNAALLMYGKVHIVSRKLRLGCKYLEGYKYPIFLRLQDCDFKNYAQIFDGNEYYLFDDVPDVKLIIDCGAFIGLSSIRLLNKFGDARIIAVEPDPENIAICSKNLKPFNERVKIINAAIVSRKWQKPRAQGIDINSLLEESGFETIDILKINIGESGIGLFSHDYETWLNKVRNIIIELHGEDHKKVFFRALSGYNYEMFRSGESTICKNISPKARAISST